MDLKEYIFLSERTLINKGKELNLVHSAAGVFTELGEIVDNFKKHIFYGKELDLVNLKEEIGDVAWYIAIPFREIKSINIDYVLKSLKEYKLEKDNKLKTEFQLWQLIKDISSFIIQYTDNMDYLINSKDEKVCYFVHGFKFLESLCEYFDINFEDVLETNINKLKVRYPDKFSEFNALNRDLQEERKVLEGN